MLKVISIHDGHSASVAYMVDGNIEFAIQEERLSLIKNQGGFPHQALQETLTQCGISIHEIDQFVFVGYNAATSMVDRNAILKRYKTLANEGPRPWKRLCRAYLSRLLKPEIARQRQQTHNQQKRMEPLLLKGVSSEKISFIEHHLCHAAAAAFGWGKKDNIAVITSDSSGDGISGSVSLFKNGTFTRYASISVHDSIARLYATVTYFMGMVPLEHECKIMGLAPYGAHSTQSQSIANALLDLFEFDNNGLTFKRKKHIESVRHFSHRIKTILMYHSFHSIAAGLQSFVEQFISTWVNHSLITLGCDKVALAGGLFMNVKLNQAIMNLDAVNDMFVFPSCGDETTVFGALYYHYFSSTGHYPTPMTTAYLGGQFSQQDVKSYLDTYTHPTCTIAYEYYENIEEKIASLLAQHHIVARVKGRMEFGARALGNRSILANPTHPDVIREINQMIKCRDFWMPFAPAMIHEDRYIINPKHINANYMIMGFDSRVEKRDVMRGVIHAYDGSCRPQVVSKSQNPDFYNLISHFHTLTGESVILNTSLNLHGLPMVYTLKDAMHVLEESGLHYIALDNYLVWKTPITT